MSVSITCVWFCDSLRQFESSPPGQGVTERGVQKHEEEANGDDEELQSGRGSVLVGLGDEPKVMHTRISLNPVCARMQTKLDFVTLTRLRPLQMWQGKITDVRASLLAIVKHSFTYDERISCQNWTRICCVFYIFSFLFTIFWVYSNRSFVRLQRNDKILLCFVASAEYTTKVLFEISSKQLLAS